MTDAGELTVYWQVSAYGYQAVTGSAGVTVHRRTAVVTALPQSVALNGSIDTGLSAASLSGQVSGHTLSAVSLIGSSTKHAGAEGTITPGGAVIVASGLDDIRIALELQRAARTLLGVEADRISVIGAGVSL